MRVRIDYCDSLYAEVDDKFKDLDGKDIGYEKENALLCELEKVAYDKLRERGTVNVNLMSVIDADNLVTYIET